MHRLIIGPIVLLLIHLAALAVRADRLQAIWIGPNGNGGEGSWSTPSNWNLGVIPTNGRDGNGDGLPDIYDVRIDGLPEVASRVHRSSVIAGLTLDAGDTLDLTASNLFLTDPDGEAEIVNNGNIRVSAPFQTDPRVFFAGDSLHLSGSGTIDLGTEFAQQGVIAPTEGGRLINGPGHTLSATGLFRIGRIGAVLSPALNLPAALTNEGTILASDDGTLETYLSSETHHNAGLIQATTSAILKLSSISAGAFQNRGLISAHGDGSHVQINGLRFHNEPLGIIRSSNLGDIELVSSPGAPVRNTGLIEAADGGFVRIRGQNVVNEGSGVIRARSGGEISLSDGVFHPDPAIQVVDAQSRLFINGSSVLFENEGNVLTASPGILSIGGAHIRGGELASGVGLLELGAAVTRRETILENIRLSGTASGLGFNLRGTMTVDSNLTVMPDGGTFRIDGSNASLQGTGISDFGGRTYISANPETTFQIAPEHRSQFETLQIDGHVDNSGTIGAGVIDINDTLSGTGLIVCLGIHVGRPFAGNLSPGDGIGTLSVVGNVFFQYDGNLVAELGDTESDLLQVNGNIDIGFRSGGLIVSGGTVGTSYVVAQYTGELTGVFEKVTPGYNIIYDDAAKQIRVEVIPEPATLISLIAAFVTFLAIVGRRNFFAWLKKCP